MHQNITNLFIFRFVSENKHLSCVILRHEIMKSYLSFVKIGKYSKKVPLYSVTITVE